MNILFEDFTLSILTLNKLVHRIKLYEMEQYGLQAIHVMCVYALSRNPEGLTAGELVKLTLEDKGAISRALSLLQQKGYITYDSHKYKTPARLTEEGKRISAYIDEKADRAVNAGKDVTMSHEQRQAFYTTLHQIGENLYAYYQTLLEERQKKE